MADVLRCQDQWGRWIVFTQQQWDIKSRRHPEVQGNVSSIEQALTSPSFVMIDKLHPHRECYYRRGGLPTPYQAAFLKVVVDFGSSRQRGNADGFVVTVYPANRVPTKEQRKWP